MKTTTLLLTLCAAALLNPFSASADDLEKIAGKWTVNKTNEQGQAFVQTIEIKKDKLTFRIAGSDGATLLYATGDVKLEKLGPFNVMKITGIQGGQNESNLSPVEDDRTLIYQLGYNTWTLASNFDKERDQSPSLDVYKKAEK